MAAKSRVDAVEADWQVYNETYVATIGVAADMAAIAATLLGRTRSADLWRYPIAENVKAIGGVSSTRRPDVGGIECRRSDRMGA